MPPVQNALPTPNAVLRGPFGSLVIVPSGVDAGGLWRFQVFAPHGGAPDSSQIHANQIVQELARDASGLMAIRQLYGNRWGGLVGLSPSMMVARLRRDLADGIMFAAFYIPSWDFTGFAVTNTVDISGLLADPPGTPLSWSPAQRIAAMLRRIPGCMAPALRATAEGLLTPKAVALFAAFAVGLAVSQAFVAGEFVDSILVAAAWWFAGWQGLMALKNFISAIIDAAGETTLVPIQADAQVAADALATLGLLFLAAILHRAADQEKVLSRDPTPPKEPPPAKKPPPVVKGWKDFPSTAKPANTIAAKRGVTVTKKGFDTVVNHLAQFGEHGPNSAMIDRLGGQIGSEVTGADANFYTHELLESEFMGSGMEYDEAHAAALDQAGVSPFSLYHPDVIQQFPDQFNDNWRAYWGLQ